MLHIIPQHYDAPEGTISILHDSPRYSMLFQSILTPLRVAALLFLYTTFNDITHYSKACWHPWGCLFYFTWYSAVFHSLSKHLDTFESTSSIVTGTTLHEITFYFQALRRTWGYQFYCFLYQMPRYSMLVQSIMAPLRATSSIACYMISHNVPCYSTVLRRPWGYHFYFIW